MNWLDLFIALFLISSLIRGVEVGFVRQFFSTVGFFGGLFFGAWAESRAIHWMHTPTSRTLLALVVTLGSALLVMTAGEYAGLRIKFKLRETVIVDKLDRILGSALAAIALLAAVWLGASIFRNIPDGGWQKEIRSSRIVTLLDSNLPPAPNVLTKLGHLIDPNGFPQVFTGLEPHLQTDTPLPNMGALTAAVQKDRASIVKIEGGGCGGVVEGSGFVAADHLVITNAHVVAGVARPVVLDQAGQHQATVVSFDPDLDLAILHTDNLAGAPLQLNGGEAASGTPGALAGYPGGGGFTAKPAAILDMFTATGRNIYNQGSTSRRVYSVKADVQQGNSGGPLINTDGAVIGVVFAKSTSYDQVGYALTMDHVIAELTQAQTQSAATSTGGCAE